MSLTDRQLRHIKPADKKQTFADGGGLSFEVKPAALGGTRRFVYNYRFEGKQKTLVLGRFPDMGLAEAREAHQNARRLLAAGTDPAAAKQEAKQARRAEVVNSFEHIAREWHREQLPRWTPNHAGRVLDSLEADVFPALGGHAIASITAPQVLETVRAIEARGVSETASRVLQRMGAIFNYAIRTGRAADNPALPLRGVVVVEKAKHQPALPQSRLTEFYGRLQTTPMRKETRIALLLIMLTTVRPGNIRFAEWAEIDRKKREWHIPAEKMKKRAAHIVPLSDWALELLDTLHGLTGESRYLFPSYKDFGKPHSQNALSYAMGRMGYAGIATPHGFRSLATDVLNEHNFKPDVIERQLAHVEQNKVRAAYHRTEYLPERHKMMQWYSDWLRRHYDAAAAMVKDGV